MPVNIPVKNPISGTKRARHRFGIARSILNQAVANKWSEDDLLEAIDLVAQQIKPRDFAELDNVNKGQPMHEIY
ncbi:hypothetical protein [Halobacillus trueperi]|uniref:hypothetical protein n=1 Tax=Halobacillus trueperi TaxID=156205 RepID=UPI0011C02F64|nr:hypothetical protein [Halobacillus trueperi]